MGEPELIYLLGDPVAHSLSPAFQTAGLRVLGLPWDYVPRRVNSAQLPDVLRGLRRPGVIGANVTVPHKVAALEGVDALGMEAAITGAVNTLIVSDDGLVGHNTDVDGFLAALGEASPGELPRPVALVIGAGGAARAVVRGLVREGLVESVLVVSRSPERVQRLNDIVVTCHRDAGENPVRLDVLTSVQSLAPERRRGVGVVVNATPVGLGRLAHETPLPDLTGFPPDTLIFDLIYGRHPTPLLRDAAAVGFPTEDGLKMLLHQGARSLALWTGREPPVEVMREALARAAAQVERR